MAGDWIKMRSSLWDHPKVVRIVSAICPQGVRDLSVRCKIVGALFRTWALADAHTSDGILDGYDADALDAAVGIEGWALNLQHVGWLTVEPQRLIVPRFEEHNGQSAKRRAEDAARKNRVRKMSEERPQNVRSVADKKRTREEKRREDKNTKGVNPLKPPAHDIPAALDCALFRAAWADFLAHRNETRKPLRPTGIKALLAKLEGWGSDRAVAAIRHSIANGWQGIFEEQSHATGNRKERTRVGPGQQYDPAAVSPATF